MELTSSTDSVFIICGLINPTCVYQDDVDLKVDIPHDPIYEMLSINSCQKQMPSVVLYFPSTGLYYLPWFVTNTGCLWPKGMWLHNQFLARTLVLQMLPTTSLQIQKGSGLPGADGQLHTFTDIFQFNVHSTCTLILTLLPVFQDIHVSNSNICTPWCSGWSKQ